MNSMLESGKSQALLLVVVVGVVLVAGTLYLMNDSGDNGDLGDDAGNVAVHDTEIINTIEGGDAAPSKEDEEADEEVPAYIRTVSAQGSTMYIGADQVDIKLPGRGSVKAYKLASPLNRKMAPYHKKPDTFKAKPHPSGLRRGERQEGEPEKVENEGSEDSTDSSGDKLGGGGSDK